MLLPIVTHPAYILACVLLAIAGRRRRAGFFGFLIISWLLTPLGALFILIVAGPKPAPSDQ